MFDTIIKILITLVSAGLLLAILPVSPFVNIVNTLGELPYISWLNWFFPVGQCITTFSLWLVALGVYYGISWILKQLDLIGF